MKKEEEYGGDSTKEYIAWEEAHTKGSRFVYTRGTAIHAENKIAGGFIPFLVLGFWDENTEIYAGDMPYRRNSPATTRI